MKMLYNSIMSFDKLWSKDNELNFFKYCENFASPEKLFYVTDENRYLAYWPKDYTGKKSTLQSRNSLIGNYTEKWTTDLINSLIKDEGLFAVQGVQCSEIGLNNRSLADVVISTKNKTNLKPDEIKLIFEVKMSLVWNWELNFNTNSIDEIGDYKTHYGNPSLLRSDSMLKAIGKCINIRVSNYQSAKIPLIVIGNAPIAKSYFSKVDHLKNAGVIQGFWSVNPKPLNNEDTLKSTPKGGFTCFDNTIALKNAIDELIDSDLNFFSSMKSKEEIGMMIEAANMKATYEEKGCEFLRLLNGD